MQELQWQVAGKDACPTCSTCPPHVLEQPAMLALLVPVCCFGESGSPPLLCSERRRAHTGDPARPLSLDEDHGPQVLTIPAGVQLHLGDG